MTLTTVIAMPKMRVPSDSDTKSITCRKSGRVSASLEVAVIKSVLGQHPSPRADWNLEERGTLFIEPGMPVYGGMIIGRHTRPQDLDVNPLKSKHLTNIRGPQARTMPCT